ncbi:MAG: DNA primase [bacterium]
MAGIISKRVLEEIRLRNNVLDVVSSYIPVQRVGSTFKTLCPFHKEKTPSFNVNQERQIYHCFGCGAGGDVFGFVMKYEGVDFVTAAKMLASRAGIKIEYDEGGDRDDNDKAALFTLLDQVTHFYQDLLHTGEAGKPGRDYLKTRDIPDEFVKEFQIGYAPEGWDTVLTWARTHKHTPEQLEAAGLIIRSTKPDSRSAHYDRFRGRLMFPIHDSQGRAIGFSGRVIISGDKEGAKYVNTPDTALFHKSQVLYALHRARHDLVEKRVAIICEGQIDVLRCHIAGFKNAVAAQGTAFTEQHARIIKRFVDSVLLVFDSDKAGQDAAIKASKVFMQAGLAARVVKLPAGEDPDSFIRTKGPTAFQALIDKSLSSLEFQVQVLESREDIRSEVGIMRAAKALLQSIVETPNAVQRAALLKEAAGLLGLPQSALEQELRNMVSKPMAAAPGEAAKKPFKPVQRRPEELRLAEHIIAEPALATLVEKYLPIAMISDLSCAALISAAAEAARTKQNVMSILAERDDTEGSLVQLAAEVQMAPARAGAGEFTRENAVKGLILWIIGEEFKKRRSALEHELQSNNGKVDESLFMRIAQYTTDLKLLKQWNTALPLLELNQHGH